MRFRYLCLLLLATALAGPASALAAAHVVVAGETLSSVAAADGLTTSQLAAANGLDSNAGLITGQTLDIPPQSTGAGGATDSASSAGPASGQADTSGGAYVVQPGDTLSAIALRAGTTVASLAAANGLDPGAFLISGTVLRLSGPAPSAATPAPQGTTAGAQGTTAGAQGTTAGATAQAGQDAPPYPTHETVSAGEVGSIAAANGVPASFADAIGWQESGFNNDRVSASDARGVMQILPGTWSWIQANLAGGSLAPASAADNVRGGVLYLRELLSASGGDPALAAAGYYQGLASVQQAGMYASTRNYVASVLALQRRFGGG